MYSALSGLVGETLDMTGTLLGDMAPLYALPLGLATVFAVGYFLRGMFGGD